MIYAGIDPGPKESHVAFYDTDVPLDAPSVRTFDNEDFLQEIHLGKLKAERLAIEMFSCSYGSAVGKESLETVLYIGRLQEAWRWGVPWQPDARLIYRKTAVTHLTGNPKAGDSGCRQALIDRYGGESVALRKAKKCFFCRGKGTRPSEGIAPICEDCGDTGRAPGQVGVDGPLVGVTGHLLAALAIAITAAETSE